MKSSNDVILPFVLLDTALLFKQQDDVMSQWLSISFCLLALFYFGKNIYNSLKRHSNI